MGNRLTRIYTRTGDDGSTGLSGQLRVGKDDPRIEAIGCVDELNSAIGLVLAQPLPERLRQILTPIQHRLFDLGGQLSMPDYPGIANADVEQLEHWLDELNDTLPPLKEFILPGGSAAGAASHLARTVCRRCERVLVALSRQEALAPELVRYVNRLSDLLFVAARAANRQDGDQEVYWRPR